MDKRRTRRFQLELPVSITRAGADGVAAPGLTKNISSSGVLLTTGAEADLGVPIEYTIALNHIPVLTGFINLCDRLLYLREREHQLSQQNPCLLAILGIE